MHPHTENLRLTERYRRLDFGHMEIQETLSDGLLQPAVDRHSQGYTGTGYGAARVRVRPKREGPLGSASGRDGQ